MNKLNKVISVHTEYEEIKELTKNINKAGHRISLYEVIQIAERDNQFEN